ncbi:electron transport complex subunit RsxE [Miniphocaeibacter massiliensis]|uniref:electron transport complex subunit RsxE n=1 Tax=Miniphocaeibacter massiliensis TaxID=2041841 RepID=UPI000C1BE1BE|nr:electron transport complex subunit E [Miniphocaeibacter massiliensis]
MGFKKILKDGIIGNNPVLIQLVGLCSVLGVSTSVINALGMGVSLMFVLILSNLVISVLRNFIPDDIRIPCYIVVIATFVTIVDLVIKAYMPELYAQLGIFIPLIVVNCIILARAEGFASKFGPVQSIVDGVANGIGYTLVITILALFREVLGAGSIFGFEFLSGDKIKPIGIIGQAPGSFILLGFILAAFNYILYKRKKKAEEEDE